MNGVASNDANDRPVSLNNEATPDALVFASADPAPNFSAALGGGVFIKIGRRR